MREPTSGTLIEGLVLAGRREVQVHLVNDQVHGNGVVHGNLDQLLRCKNLDLIARYGNAQLLHLLKDGVADHVLRVAIHNRELGFLLYFVGELVFREIDGKNLEGSVGDKYQDRGPYDGFQPPRTALRATGSGRSEERRVG